MIVCKNIQGQRISSDPETVIRFIAAGECKVISTIRSRRFRRGGWGVEKNKNPERIIELLSLISGEVILPEKTLILLDEVQECPDALNSLKYFKERASAYHIISAGSLLGTLLARPKSYPVGMVNLLEIYENDFSKHNGRINSGRILMVFRSIVSQLAKENGKFMYGAVKEGGRPLY